MERHSLRQFKWNMQQVVKRLREKFDERFISPTQFIDIVGPVYEQPAPYHYSEYRKI
jgi:hypothetical protein